MAVNSGAGSTSAIEKRSSREIEQQVADEVLDPRHAAQDRRELLRAGIAGLRPLRGQLRVALHAADGVADFVGQRRGHLPDERKGLAALRLASMSLGARGQDDDEQPAGPQQHQHRADAPPEPADAGGHPVGLDGVQREAQQRRRAFLLLQQAIVEQHRPPGAEERPAARSRAFRQPAEGFPVVEERAAQVGVGVEEDGPVRGRDQRVGHDPVGKQALELHGAPLLRP